MAHRRRYSPARRPEFVSYLYSEPDSKRQWTVSRIPSAAAASSLTTDQVEAMSAFRERRSPDYSWR